MTMNVDQYLRRINVKKPIHVDFESLNKLQNKHLLSIAFENLDVMNNVWIPLDVESHYNKIIKRKRGGFCYELNGLFHWLLKRIGYSNYLIGCTVRRRDGNWGQPKS